MKYIKTYNESREELTSEEGKEFLDIVRQKLPEKVNRYMSLIVNKGLDASKKDFELNDPDEVKRKKKINDINNYQGIKYLYIIIAYLYIYIY